MINLFQFALYEVRFWQISSLYRPQNVLRLYSILYLPSHIRYLSSQKVYLTHQGIHRAYQKSFDCGHLHSSLNISFAFQFTIVCDICNQMPCRNDQIETSPKLNQILFQAFRKTETRGSNDTDHIIKSIKWCTSYTGRLCQSVYLVLHKLYNSNQNSSSYMY